MNYRCSFMLAAALLASAISSPSEEPPIPPNTPREAWVHFHQGFCKRPLEICPGRNPFWVRGDFWGTGEPGFAIWVRNTRDKSLGFLLFKKGEFDKPFLVGAGGDDLGYPRLQNLSWIDVWQVITPKEASHCLKDDEHPQRVVKGEGLIISGDDYSVLLYWDGKRWRADGD